MFLHRIGSNNLSSFISTKFTPRQKDQEVLFVCLRISCQGLSKMDSCFERHRWLWKREPWVMGRAVRWGLHRGWAPDMPPSLSTCEVCPEYHFKTQTGFHLFIPTNGDNGLSSSKSGLPLVAKVFFFFFFFKASNLQRSLDLLRI